MRLFNIVLPLLILSATAAAAPVCGEAYTVQRGDTLSRLAETLYGDAQSWSRIFYTNRDTLGDDPAQVFPGQVIVPPCAAAPRPAQQAQDTAPAPAAPPPDTPEKPLYVLTADDFHPFADPSLPGGGLAVELIDTALRRAGLAHSIKWVNDRSAHLDPLLGNLLFDIGVPWSGPDCTGDPDRFECAAFLYSAPIFEMVVQLFVRRDSSFGFERDADVEGRVLCRPDGHPTHDLDARGRGWIRDSKIILVSPPQVVRCFELLLEGQIDAVAINEFTGRTAIATLGLRDDVVALPRALSLEPLHAIVARNHPQAERLIEQIDTALDAMAQTGDYNEIVAEHLALFWRDNG